MVGQQDLDETAWDLDTAAADFARAMSIRRFARSQLFEQGCQARVRAAAWAPRHRDTKYSPGDWVYVWRRAPRTQRKTYALQRDRWTGPGVVVFQHNNSVWVSMRARLWIGSCRLVTVSSATEGAR